MAKIPELELIHLLVWLCCLFGSLSCLEPMCSKFHYAEQILEKVIRTGIKIESIEKEALETREAVKEVLESLRKENNDIKLELSTLKETFVGASTEMDAVLELQESKITRISEDLRKLKNSTGQRVAFTAYLDHRIDTLTVGQSIPFDSVLLDVGHNYNSKNGHFLAPEQGTYFFTWHTQTLAKNSLTTCLAINDACQIHAYANARSDQHSDIQNDGNSAVLNLKSGDTVAISVRKGTQIYSNIGSKWFYPTFSGFLLF